MKVLDTTVAIDDLRGNPAASQLLEQLETGLLTTNVRHFPMFAGLEPPYEP